MLEEDIINQHLRSLSKRDPYELRKSANFELWCSHSLWSLDEAVALLIGFEPNIKNLNSFYSTREFDEIYKRLQNDVIAGHIEAVSNEPIAKSQTKPSDFVRWAETLLKKKGFLPAPEVSNGARLMRPTRVPPIIKCAVDDPRIAEYLTNLETMKAHLSPRPIESVKPDCGERSFLSHDKESNNKHNNESDNKDDARIKKIIEEVIRDYPKATSAHIISHCFGCFKGNNRKLDKIKKIIKDLGVVMNVNGGRLSIESKKCMQNAPIFKP